MSGFLIIVVSLTLYFFVTIGLGVFSHKQSTDNTADFFLAGRSLSWPHLTFTYVGTWMSTMACVEVPGLLYSTGVNWLITMTGFFAFGLVLMWFIGPKLRKQAESKNAITPAELLGSFYESQILVYMIAIISIIGLVPYCLIQTIAIGKVVSAATQDIVSYEIAILLSAIAAAIYVFIGGVRAIVLTDIAQVVLFSLVIMFAAFFVLDISGGLSTGFTRSLEVNPNIFSIDSTNWGKTITLITTWGMGFILLPHMWQRNFMAQSDRDLRRSVLAQSSIYIVLITLLGLIGMLSAGFIDGLQDTDKLVPELYTRYASWALPVVILATFAAGMSTLDSQLLTASSVFIRDIICPFSKFKLLEKRGKQLSRYLVLVLILFITLLALLPQAQGPIIELASKGIALVSLLSIPLFGFLFWKKATALGAIIGMLVGIIVQIIFETEIIAYTLPYGFGSAIPSLILGFMMFYSVSVTSKVP